MKKWIALLLALLLTISSAVVGYAEETTAAEGSSQTGTEAALPENPTVLGEFAKLGPDRGNWIGLTREQRIVDFDTLMQCLRENYPYFATLKRMYGVDLEEQYRAYRPLIADAVSDAEFFVLVDRFVSEANMVGHLNLISPLDYGWYVQTYQGLISGVPVGERGRFQLLADTFGNPRSQKSYEACSKILMPIFDRVMAYYAAQEDGDEADGQQAVSQPYSNVEMKILEQGKTAYINVKSFDMQYYDVDKQKLFQFYRQIKHYPNVIFDFTQNGGGGMSYFDDLIVAPNISQPLSTAAYQLAKDGDLNRKFLGFEDARPVSELPSLARMNPDDKDALDWFYASSYGVMPLSKEKMLDGKLWLLVSENVFSSSEYAAMFSKATGFATLVGTTTGGDGIGVDPIPFVMPNSGLIVRYSPIYGATPDGAGSQEYGTDPNIFSSEGETALETCLRAIKQQS